MQLFKIFYVHQILFMFLGLEKHWPLELYSSNIFYVSETVLLNQWSQSYFIEQKPLVWRKNFNKFLLLTTNVSETTFLLEHI